ncbi:hypothetical protein PHMEG_00023937 [Phytophthora megakarya]|uniref:Reverse transcriptase n=1 Tax=Phytophthora megakarya TaxID=4795 RepID=A0A225VGV0_9STRA|nr:hypothetical protein PHMEG_00023937 [Phytophthora megakarya]
MRIHVTPDKDELSFELQPGERRGWWEANSWDDSSWSVAFVHDSVFHHRTLLMIDSGSSTSITSPDVVLLNMLKNQLAYLPDLSDLRPEANIEDAIVVGLRRGREAPGDPPETPNDFLGRRERASPPVQGVVCDLEVGDAKPISMRSRRIPAGLLSKMYELLKRLLETGLIEYSDSEWASAIVLVMKKNGTDVCLYIDYRLVNKLIKLMNYPYP